VNVNCLLAGKVEPGRINLSSHPYGGRVRVCGERVYVNSRVPFESGNYLFIGSLVVKGELLVVDVDRLFPSKGEGLFVLGLKGIARGVRRGKGWYSFRLFCDGGEIFCVSREPVKEGWEVLIRGELKRKKSSYFLVDVEVINPIVEIEL